MPSGPTAPFFNFFYDFSKDLSIRKDTFRIILNQCLVMTSIDFQQRFGSMKINRLLLIYGAPIADQLLLHNFGARNNRAIRSFDSSKSQHSPSRPENILHPAGALQTRFDLLLIIETVVAIRSAWSLATSDRW